MGWGADFNRFHHQKPLGSIFFSAFPPPPPQKNNGKKHLRAQKTMCKYPISRAVSFVQSVARQFFLFSLNLGNDGLETPAIVGLGGPGAAFFLGDGGGVGGNGAGGLFFFFGVVEIDSTNGLNWCLGVFFFGRVEIDSTNGLDWVVFSAWYLVGCL